MQLLSPHMGMASLKPARGLLERKDDNPIV
jgi:hypothetical protein